MAQNKNALIRYKTIDRCLQNKFKEWTLDDLIDACSEALYEYEGKDVNVSKRTVQLDIQLMRSDKLGYNAPIVVYNKKYYRYEDENYSIANIPLTENDLSVLTETVEMLKQFKDFSLFSELTGIIQKLEDKVFTEQSNKSAIIYMDKNENLLGLEYLDVIYQAILKEICLDITYQSFRAREASEFTFHPYILKEFNNRWFAVGRKHNSKPVLTLALDRIIQIKPNLRITYQNENFDGESYYKNTIGVTVLNDDSLQEIHLKVNAYNAPYVLTKPFHHTQELIGNYTDGSILISLKVHLNFEFTRLLMGFADAIEVIKPRKLKNAIKAKLQRGLEMYVKRDQER